MSGVGLKFRELLAKFLIREDGIDHVDNRRGGAIGRIELELAAFEVATHPVGGCLLQLWIGAPKAVNGLFSITDHKNRAWCFMIC